ncbi:phage portal protein [Meridianimarinicoccus roseus]|uniref:Phage portal protein n=1 Tax=Meridianimarinicoccus roseus TaxID=2072018 RepID=A0A2V2LCI9_9RHOB|nr:phage portal protein [Meridianimarinicoccus roseus]PWR03055.1 phage portal protein [Meridianimarinicoccus roseus]
MKLDFLKREAPKVPQTPPAAPQRKAATGAVLAMAAAGAGGVGIARDGAALVRHGFAGNPVGFRSVKMIAEAAAALPLVVQDAACRYDAHPVGCLVARPNPAQGRAELLEALVGQILLTGNGYLEAVGGAPGALPLELHVLRGDRMAVVPGADGWPVAYDYRVGSKVRRFDMTAEVPPLCHIRNFHPSDDHYGLAPLQAAAGAVEVHNAASRWSKALLDNAARPSGAITYQSAEGQGMMPGDLYDRLVDEITTNYMGARNAGRPMLLEGGLDWKPMGFSPSDMEFQKTKEAAAREIALAFGVPPMLLGIPGDATYANYQEANRAFYRLTVLPMAARVVAQLSAFLGRFTGDAVEVQIDLDKVPALSAEREAQWRRVAAADFLSADEKRAMLGLPPRNAGEAT